MAYQDTITVACANIHSLPGDKAANLMKCKNLIGEAASQGNNLIIFPEMFLTAASAPLADPSNSAEIIRGLAETIPGPSTEELMKEAQAHNIYVVATLPEKDKSNPDVVYNSAALIGPEEGLIGTHRKVHLFGLEKPYTTRGQEWSVFETRYGPIGIVICADFYRFPEAARILALKGARLIALPTAAMAPEPDAKSELAITLEGALEEIPEIIKVRSLENRIYIASANEVGKSVNGLVFFGKSLIVGPHPPASYTIRFFAGPASQVEEELIMATLDLKSMDEVRELQFEERLPQTYGAITR